MQHRYIVTDLK